MSVSAVEDALVLGRSRIARGHCKTRAAVDATGQSVDPVSVEAVAWCVIGSLGGVERPTKETALDAVRAVIVPPLGGREFVSLSENNDAPGTTQTMVLGWFDSAITEARNHGA